MSYPNTCNKFIDEYKVYLLYSSNERIEITQPPGTKYPYLPSDYQADTYVLVKYDGTETHINDHISVNMTPVHKTRRSILY